MAMDLGMTARFIGSELRDGFSEYGILCAALPKALGQNFVRAAQDLLLF